MNNNEHERLYEEIDKIPGKEYVKIPATKRTPKIMLDRTGEEGMIQFLGRSLTANARRFYNPILSWIQEYVSYPHQKTFVRFRLEYYNTASSKMLIQIIRKLEKLEKYNKNVVIEWCYMEDDESILQLGKTFQDLTNVKLNFVCY